MTGAKISDGETSPAGFIFGFFRDRILFHAQAAAVELQDDGVMNEAVDGSHGGHLVFEDLIPLGKHQLGAEILLGNFEEERKEGLV